MSDVFCPFYPIFNTLLLPPPTCLSIPFLFIGKLSQAYLLCTADLMYSLPLLFFPFHPGALIDFGLKREPFFILLLLCMLLSLSLSLATVHFLTIYCPFLCPCVCRSHTIGRRRSTVCHDIHSYYPQVVPRHPLLPPLIPRSLSRLILEPHFLIRIF